MGAELLEEITAKNSPNLAKDVSVQNQEAEKISNKINP